MWSSWIVTVFELQFRVFILHFGFVKCADSLGFLLLDALMYWGSWWLLLKKVELEIVSVGVFYLKKLNWIWFIILIRILYLNTSTGNIGNENLNVKMWMCALVKKCLICAFQICRSCISHRIYENIFQWKRTGMSIYV